MPDVQLKGSDTILRFPDTMPEDQILQVLRTHPAVQQIREAPYQLDPNEQKFWSQYANQPDSAPFKKLQELQNSTPSEWSGLLQGYSQIGRNVLTKLATVYNQPKPTSTYIQRGAQSLGVTPQDIKTQGINPAVQANLPENQYEMIQLPPSGGPEAPPMMLRKKGTNQLASPMQAGASLPGYAMNRALGPGTWEEIQKMGGTGRVAQLLGTLMEPENIAAGMAIGGAPKLLQSALLAGIGGPLAYSGAQDISKGDIVGGATKALAGGAALLGAKGSLKRPPSAPVSQLPDLPTPVEAPPKTAQRLLPPAPEGTPQTNVVGQQTITPQEAIRPSDYPGTVRQAGQESVPEQPVSQVQPQIQSQTQTGPQPGDILASKSGLEFKYVGPESKIVKVAGAKRGKRVFTGNEVVEGVQSGTKQTVTPEALSNLSPKSKSGTLNMGFGPTGQPGEEPLFTVAKAKAASQNIANQLRQYNDELGNAFNQGQSFLQRVAPGMARGATEYAASHDVLEAQMAKIEDAFQGMSEADRQKIGAAIAEDRAATKGTNTFDPAQFLSDPRVKPTVDKYINATNEIYPEYREAGGYGEAQSVGQTSGAFMPLRPKEQAEFAGTGGRPATKPILELGRLPGEEAYGGKLNSTNAITDPITANRLRLSGLIPSGAMRKMLQAGRDEGILTPVPEDFNGTMNVGGHEVPAQRVSIADRFGVSDQEMQAMGLQKQMIMPSQAIKELDPIMSSIKNPPPVKNSPLNIAIRGYLLSPSDVGAHTFTLSSLGRASQKVAVSTGFAPLDRILSSVGTTRFAAGIKDIVAPTYSRQEAIEASILAAKAGVFKTAPAKVDFTQPGARILYGPKGIYERSLTGVYKMMKGFGASDGEIMDAFRTLPSHISSRQPTAQKILNVVGMGTFYSTGKSALVAAYKYGARPERLLATAAFLTIAGAALDKDHKPWFDKDRKLLPGQYYMGMDEKTGKPVIGDLRFDRTTRLAMEVPSKIIQAKQRGATNAEAAEQGAYALGNQLVRPAASGPTAAAASRLTGLLPMVVPSDEYRGPKILPSQTATQGLDKRAAGLWRTLLPLSENILGSESDEYAQNVPEDTKYKILSRVLRTVGQGGLKTATPGQAEYYIQKNRQTRNQKEAIKTAKANK